MAGRDLERERESLPLSSSAPTPSPMALDLPTGFIFRPTDEDLLGYYLRRKLVNKTYPNAIAELGIYDYDPADLPLLSKLKSEEVWFFFTRRIIKNGRVKRETPSGSWSVDEAVTVTHIKDKNDNVAGTKQSFKFFLRTQEKHVKETNWTMEEFQVDGGVFVLCKISLRKPPVKRTLVKRTPAMVTDTVAPAMVTDTVMVEAHEEEILGLCVLNREASVPDDYDVDVRYCNGKIMLPKKPPVKRTPVKRTPAMVTDTVMVEAHEEEILGLCVLNREASVPDDYDVDVRYCNGKIIF